MDPTNFLDKLYAFRDEILFFWQNPETLKTELFANVPLLIEVIAAIIIFVLLIIILFKPAAKEKMKVNDKPQKGAPPQKSNTTPAQKTFSKALLEQQKKDPSLSTRPARPLPKKTEQAPIHELTEDEERALAEAMSIAGKQALAEVTGEPHQTEIFQNSQANEVAKKIFAGEIRSQNEEAGTVASGPPPSALEFIMVHFMAPRSQAFEGEALFNILRHLGLSLNDQHVFEYVDEAGLQFYVTSALKPGYFDIHRLHYSVPGVSFVLDLVAVQNPQAAFEKMLACIHELSQLQKGDILDFNRQRLTQSSIHQYMARIKSFHK